MIHNTPGIRTITRSTPANDNALDTTVRMAKARRANEILQQAKDFNGSADPSSLLFFAAQIPAQIITATIITSDSKLITIIHITSIPITLINKIVNGYEMFY